MNSENSNLYSVLLNCVVDELSRGVRILEVLDDETYLRSKNGIGSVGAHIRHNLDFAGNFIRGIEIGEIDYNLRERNLRVEKDRQYAKERSLFLIRRLMSVPDQMLKRKVRVCSEVDDTQWHTSTGVRELEFLHSHTIHHYALIAEKLGSYGMDVSADFGVSPSTLKYWAKLENKAKVA